MALLLIRYSELALKSPRVRSRFQNRLIRNIENAFIRNNQDCTIDHDWGRIYIYPDDQEKGIEILRHIFGIVSLSPVIETTSDLEAICDATVEYSKPLLIKGGTFAIKARRTGEHKFTSLDVATKVGAAVLEANRANGVTVNLSAPDVKIFVEVRNNKVFVFSEKIAGPGGLPLGTQGKAVGMLTDKNSTLAMWLIMKRGCRVLPVYFRADVDEAGKAEAVEALEKLKIWDPLLALRFMDDREQLSSNDFDHEGYSISEYLAAEKFARKMNADAIVSGEMFEQLNNKPDLAEKYISYPVFYPLGGLGKKALQNLDLKVFGN